MSLNLPRHLRRPTDDGYRTPTIEDVESYVALRERYEDPYNPAQRQQNGSASGSYFPPSNLATPPATKEAPTRLTEHKSETSFPQEIKISIRERVRHFTWTWFTMSMATGGIANVIYNGNVVMIALRFSLHRGTFRVSFTHPTESLFIPASIVSIGTILMNISQYGVNQAGYWLNTTVMMTPIWVFPAYPLLIVGPHAGTLSASLSPGRALDIIIGGFTIQAIGFMVSLMIYSAFIYRLMTQKLPREPIRPGMFVSVGPAGFTVSGIVSMASNLERVFPSDFMGDGKMTAFVLRVIGNWMGLWLWGLTLWFFIISVGAHFSTVHKGGMPFAMTWYSFVFPQTAMTTATLAIGKAFSSHAIQIIGTVMAGLVVGVWIFVFVMNIRAVVTGQILLPQKGEDRDEGGFKREDAEKRREEERKRRDEHVEGKLARRMTEKTPAS
ncbi:MAG: hypothetical protein M4579_005596 [Chaenotheca gracillima]|nr:MAG: hypothetical protein M4579_005596 [Chaenotheca gracillima]